MKETTVQKSEVDNIIAIAQSRLGRRSFMRNASLLGLGAATAGLTLGSATPARADEKETAAARQQERQQGKRHRRKLDPFRL